MKKSENVKVFISEKFLDTSFNIKQTTDPLVVDEIGKEGKVLSSDTR